jgi:hypothetical protein
LDSRTQFQKENYIALTLAIVGTILLLRLHTTELGTILLSAALDEVTLPNGMRSY